MTEPNHSNRTTARLLELASARFKKPAGSLNASDDMFDALGIDSYQAMELLTDVEEAFGVEIPDYELRDAKTFAALATLVDRRL